MRADNSDEVSFSHLIPHGARRSLAGKSRWLAYDMESPIDLRELVQLANEVSVSTSAPVLTSWIQASDYAYVHGTRPGLPGFHIVTSPQGAAGYEEGAIALELSVEQQGGPGEWLHEAASRAVQWAEANGTLVDPGEIEAAVTDAPVFAEDGLASLLRLLGMPPDAFPLAAEEVDPLFEGAVQLEDTGSAVSRGREVDRRTARYVVGYGQDFVGIWDRETPGPPILRFPADRMFDALREWSRLVGLPWEDDDSR